MRTVQAMQGPVQSPGPGKGCEQACWHGPENSQAHLPGPFFWGWHCTGGGQRPGQQDMQTSEALQPPGLRGKTLIHSCGAPSEATARPRSGREMGGGGGLWGVGRPQVLAGS